jgi:hypothetical protein
MGVRSLGSYATRRCRNLAKNSASSGQPAHRVTVAKDHDLTRVFDSLVAAPVYFLQEQIHSGKPVDIARLAPDDGTLLYSLAGEQIVQPNVRRKG